MVYFTAGSKLLPDFFLDTEDPQALRDQMEQQGAKPAFGDGSKTEVSGGPAKTFQQIQALLNEELVKSIGGIFQFNLSGKGDKNSDGLQFLTIFPVSYLLVYFPYESRVTLSVVYFLI